MATDGTTYAIDIEAPAGNAEAAAAAVARLGEQLTGASAAAAKSAEAVKAGEAAYKQAESAADRAAKALEKINMAVAAQQQKVQLAIDDGEVEIAEQLSIKLRKLNEHQSAVASKAKAAQAAMQAEAIALDNLKVASVAASDKQTQLAKSLDSAKKTADAFNKATQATKATGDLSAAGKAMKKLGGPLGQVADVAEGLVFDMKDLAGSIGAVGAAAAGVALLVAALAAAILATTAATAIWAVKLADTARTTQLLTDGIAGTVEGGSDLADTIKDLSKRVPQTRDELRSMAADLAKTGLKGQELADALEESATKAAELKWGPNFKKQTLSLNKLATRFGDNVADLFGRIDIDPLLEGLGKLVDLFDENSVTGKVMRDVFESLFQPLVDAVANIIPKVIAGFIQLQIWILKALIAIKPFGSEILLVAQVVGVLAAVVVGALVAALAIGVGIAIAFWAAMIKLTEGTMAAYDAIVGFGKGVIDYLSNLSLEQLGTDLINGLVTGITGGGSAVIDALTGIVGGAIDAAKSALGIASPSKVFAEIGMQTAEGMAGGVEAGAGSVQGSLESMVAPPDAEAGGAVSATGGGGGDTYHITIQAAPGSTVEAYMQLVRETLTDLIEGDVAQLAGAVPT